MDEKIFYRRKLPHWQPEEESFFVTYRLAGSMPRSIIEQLKETYSLLKLTDENLTEDLKNEFKQEYFELFDKELENNLNEPHWLQNDVIASIVMESLLFYDKKQYTIWCANIMSNHVHLVLTTLKDSPLLNVILQNHKKFTARRGNKILNRLGAFWEEESFDTIIRNDRHFFNVINYCIQNPVKAGLVDHWRDWKWTYLHPELRGEFG